MAFIAANIPQSITTDSTGLVVPPFPIVPFIEGDGSGPDIWKSARRVLDAAVSSAYQTDRAISWKEVYAGAKAYAVEKSWLPEETLLAFKEFQVGIKGPLTTPIGEGMRSLNVALRKELDLYVCLRPISYFQGVPSPMLHPERINMVLFRENTEDVYTGIDYPYDSDKAIGLKKWLQEQHPDDYARLRFPETTAFGIKPISKDGSYRMIQAAMDYAIKEHHRQITLVGKGNIMKYTEGAFTRWAYEYAEEHYAEYVYTQRQWKQAVKELGEAAANQQKNEALNSGRIYINEILTDAMFERAITHPQEFDILLTTNLNGDYLADALAALVGGIGIAPGGNINFSNGRAIFEATHGTAPTLAGLNKVNPCSFILSGEMMLRHLGWAEAADHVARAVREAILTRHVTFDFYEQMEGATLASTSEFSDNIIRHLKG
jgi:isocitrate dehydrogenase